MGTTLTAAPNWLEGDNPFALPAPPAWWLQRLADFDDRLVLFPSHKSRAYLLARRRQHTAGLGDVAMLDNKHPDTNFCYRHGLLPINMPLRPTGPAPWTATSLADVLAALRRRDTWAYTAGSQDASKVGRLLDAVDDADAAHERKEHRNLRDMFYHMGRDAWRSLQARIGARNKRASDAYGVARRQPASGGTTP